MEICAGMEYSSCAMSNSLEVAELTLDHISRVDEGIVSFGQGCEGEPLLYADEAAETLRIVRAQTPEGTLNLNSNASKPDGLAKLIDAGLDSLRVSLNSARSEVYDRYYRPTDYGFEDVQRSMEIATNAGLFVALNLLVFPGISDTKEELEALRNSVNRGAPFGGALWAGRTAERLGLESTMRPRGRPYKKPEDQQD